MTNIKTVKFFFHEDNVEAKRWVQKIKGWIRKKYPTVKIVSKNPDVLIVLGGDGTIMDATWVHKNQNPIVVGLNLGNVGFLSSVREPKKFLQGLKKLFEGEYTISKRITLSAKVERKGKEVFSTDALGEVVIQSVLGVCELNVKIENHPIQYIRGTGVLVATPTGSTAYNLSAHGPIVMPTLKSIIVSELLDHNVPTPSIVLESSEIIKIQVVHFREHKKLSLGKVPVDVLLVADGEKIFPICPKDEVIITQGKNFVKFAELEPHYFFKSLHEKFDFH